MIFRKPLTVKAYVIKNFALAVLVVNTLAFGKALRMGEDFTNGVLAGFVAVWIVFAAVGARALRGRGPAFDERSTAIFAKASGAAFWFTVLFGSLLQMALRSETLGLSLSPYGVGALMSNLGLAVFFLAYILVARRS